jgi:hypothetical protein
MTPRCGRRLSSAQEIELEGGARGLDAESLGMLESISGVAARVLLTSARVGAAHVADTSAWTRTCERI